MSMQESMEEAAGQMGRPGAKWEGMRFSCYHDTCGSALSVERLKESLNQLTDNVYCGSSYGCNGFLALGIITKTHGFQQIGFFSPDYDLWKSIDFDKWKKEVSESDRCIKVAKAIESCLPLFGRHSEYGCNMKEFDSALDFFLKGVK